jgi:hypothetical protein
VVNAVRQHVPGSPRTANERAQLLIRRGSDAAERLHDGKRHGWGPGSEGMTAALREAIALHQSLQAAADVGYVNPNEIEREGRHLQPTEDERTTAAGESLERDEPLP